MQIFPAKRDKYWPKMNSGENSSQYLDTNTIAITITDTNTNNNYNNNNNNNNNTNNNNNGGNAMACCGQCSKGKMQI